MIKSSGVEDVAINGQNHLVDKLYEQCIKIDDTDSRITNMTDGSKKSLEDIVLEDQEMREGIFNDAISRLKERHAGSLVQVNMLVDNAVLRAVAAWPNVPREIRLKIDGTDDPWEMIWYAPGVWMDAARVPREIEDSVILAIRQNNLVYPDGTMPPQVHAYLVQKGRELLGLPAPKIEG